MDFTLKAYRNLVENVLNTEHTPATVRSFMKQEVKGDKIVVLRHDVDRRPNNALKMAELEASMGVQSTYYFRYMPHTFKPNLIKAISDMGHEVGYHYETLAKAKGDYAKAFDIFHQEVKAFRRLVEVETACMHGRPLSPWDNRDLWQHFKLEDVGIIGEPYLTIDYSNILYLTDTGRCWNGDKTNLRDKVNQKEKPQDFIKTEDIIAYLPKNKQTLILQTHPERWAYAPHNFMISYGADKATNLIKRAIRLVR